METTLARPQLVEPRNPFTAGEIAANAQPIGGLTTVESQRAVAEVQARMIIARTNPRDPVRAVERIMNACTRPTLAESAIYQYARGGTDIRGPSIRLAEAIAQQWGNIASGIKEISRHGGYSECVAYAWDLETGFYDERQYQVRHWRDTRQGGYQLQDERDIYELIANFGQRRKRAVLLTVIPGDVTEAALEQCERTMQAAADVTPDGVKKLIEAFAEFGVTVPQIETRIQRRLDAIRPAQIVILRKIFTSLKDGMSQPADWFDAIAGESQASSEDPAATTPAPAARRGRARRDGAAAEPPPPAPPASPQEEETPPATARRVPRFEE
jgi:hypothetical protein